MWKEITRQLSASDDDDGAWDERLQRSSTLLKTSRCDISNELWKPQIISTTSFFRLHDSMPRFTRRVRVGADVCINFN